MKFERLSHSTKMLKGKGRTQQKYGSESPVPGPHFQGIGLTSTTAGYLRKVDLPNIAKPNAEISSGETMLSRAVRLVAPLVLVDTVALVLTFTIAAQVLAFIFDGYRYSNLYQQISTLLCVFAVVYPSFGLVNVCGVNRVQEFRRTVLAISTSYLLLLVANATLGQLDSYETALLFVAAGLSLIVGPPTRLLARNFLGRCQWWGETAEIFGENDAASSVARMLESTPSLGLRPVHPPNMQSQYRIDKSHSLSDSDIHNSQTSRPPSWAIIAMKEHSERELGESVQEAIAKYPNVMVVLETAGLPTLWNSVQDFGGMLGVFVQHRLLMPFPRACKRSLDIAVVLVGGMLLLPFLGSICVVIKLLSPGPIFYGHERIGRNNRRFKAWKFRTMVQDADKTLELYLNKHPELRAEWERDHKLKNDPRIIPGVGHILRKFSIDELPQLWNVLMGEMSLVGPRPIVSAEIAKYGEVFQLYLRVTPGITGLWQISGRNNTTYEQRLNLDKYYVQNWSPSLDIYILYRTVKTVVLREGAY